MKKMLLGLQQQIVIRNLKNNKQKEKQDYKYSLILSLKQLQVPVTKIVQHIIKHSNNNQNKENKRQFQKTVQRFTKTIDKSTHHNSMNETNSSKFKDFHNDSTKDRLNMTMSSPKKFTSRVCRILSRKKYSCCDNQDQIDRLNARLDNYIIKNIGVQKVKQLRSSI